MSALHATAIVADRARSGRLRPARPTRELVSAAPSPLPGNWPIGIQSRAVFTSGYLRVHRSNEPRGFGGQTIGKRRSGNTGVGCRPPVPKVLEAPQSELDLIKNDLVSIFTTLDPEIVAPSHACIFRRRRVIWRHLVLIDVLDTADRERTAGTEGHGRYR